MRNFHWAVTAIYFSRMPYIMTNDKDENIICKKNKNCQHVK